MRIIDCFSNTFKRLKACTIKLCAAFILSITLTAIPQHVSAHLTPVSVADDIGGFITDAENRFRCRQNCRIQSPAKHAMSFFAVPDKGYRFASWEGDCADTIGPLCTLNTEGGKRVIARFVKHENLPAPRHVLLLLHDYTEKQSVWNKYIGQHFNDRCPTIYGGVLLEKDSPELTSKLACYRIAFGYYNLFDTFARNDTDLSDLNNLRKKRQHLHQQRANEIRAAILGILNRHPGSAFVLVGHGDAALATQAFLQKKTESRNNVFGLINLTSVKLTKTVGNGALVVDQPMQTKTNGVVMLNLAANPKQSRQINAGLGYLESHHNWLPR